MISRKFGRKTGPRKSLISNLAVNLFMRGKIKTTEARAKELRSFAERIIQKAKKSDLAGIRYVSGYLPKETAKKVIKEIAPKYADRQGGYTRIIKIGQRKSDSAMEVFIELIV